MKQNLEVTVHTLVHHALNGLFLVTENILLEIQHKISQ